MSHESKLLLSVLVSSAITSQVLNLWFNGSIFVRPRTWVDKHAPELVAELAGCPLCLSHWIAFVGMYLAAQFMGTDAPVFQSITTTLAYWLLTACGANIIYYKLFHQEDPVPEPGVYPLFKEADDAAK